MEISLRQLRHFVVLVEQNSFAKAAERVNVTQPALSRSIQALEADLGILLIDRSARNFQVTPAGERILERARKVLHETRDLVREAEFIKGNFLGEVRFGIGPLPAAMCLSQVLTLLSEKHPGLKVRADVDSWSGLWEKLQRETIDFLVLDHRGIPPSDNVQVRRCTPHAASWYVRPSHPLLQKDKLTITDLHAYPFAFAPLNERIKVVVRETLQVPEGEEFICIAECNDFSSLKTLATHSDSILLATDAAVATEIAAGALDKLAITNAPLLDIEIAIAYLARHERSDATEIAMQAVLDTLER